MTKCGSDPLVLAPKDDWWSLKDRFKERWPFGLTAYSAISTQCINVNKFPDYPVKIFTVFGDPDNGVVCIWSLIPNAYEIAIFSMKEDTSKITEALVKTKVINWNNRILFCNLMKEHVSCVHDTLAQLGKPITQSDDTDVVYLDKKIAENFEIEHLKSKSLQVLPPEMADDLDESWPHRYPGSLDYFRRMLNREAAIGVVDGDLRAWCLLSPRGDLHAIHTKTEYRRRGYAQLLVTELSMQLAKENREIFACIITNNESSKKLFTTLGFKLIFTVTWIQSKLVSGTV